jgi:hypothetical protein
VNGLGVASQSQSQATEPLVLAAACGTAKVLVIIFPRQEPVRRTSPRPAALSFPTLESDINNNATMRKRRRQKAEKMRNGEKTTDNKWISPSILFWQWDRPLKGHYKQL